MFRGSGYVFALIVILVVAAFKRGGLIVGGIALGIPTLCGIGAAITGGSFVAAFWMVFPWTLILGVVGLVIAAFSAMSSRHW